MNSESAKPFLPQGESMVFTSSDQALPLSLSMVIAWHKPYILDSLKRHSITVILDCNYWIIRIREIQNYRDLISASVI
ncbi:hypothetical protein ABI36_0228265 [Pseudomonas aeruginosa]|nr:hypothetical protein AN450_15915 [Pseudomonas aeruginosa]OHW55546.1 hypothetical protein ABI36_0228265 [Pseudomonas aeruginosa]